MKIIKLALLLYLLLLFLIPTIKYFTYKVNYDDCMFVYDKTEAVLYKIDDYKYHIDINDNLPYKKLGYAKGCAFYSNSSNDFFFNFSLPFNSIYCSLTKLKG